MHQHMLYRAQPACDASREGGVLVAPCERGHNLVHARHRASGACPACAATGVPAAVHHLQGV